MKIAAIIPIKTFSKAKTRLNLPPSQTEDLCKIMLEEVLQTITDSNQFEKIITVSKDETALEISKGFNTIPIFDDAELGVNHAVSLADNHLQNLEIDTSIVFPQDLPFMMAEDIRTLVNLQKNENFVQIVPSRKFDGTNALVRKPTNIMETHYDEDSYKIHLKVGKIKTSNTSLVLIRRIMLDVDSADDFELLLQQQEKPFLAEKIRSVFH